MAHESVNLETLRSRILRLGSAVVGTFDPERPFAVLDGSAIAGSMLSEPMTLPDVAAWVEQHEKPEQDSDDAPETKADELPVVTVLAGDLSDVIYGLDGLATAFDSEASGINRYHLASALRVLAQRLTDSFGAAPGSVTSALGGVAKVYG